MEDEEDGKLIVNTGCFSFLMIVNKVLSGSTGTVAPLMSLSSASISLHCIVGFSFTTCLTSFSTHRRPVGLLLIAFLFSQILDDRYSRRTVSDGLSERSVHCDEGFINIVYPYSE